jgi:hypothetical protein
MCCAKMSPSFFVKKKIIKSYAYFISHAIKTSEGGCLNQTVIQCFILIQIGERVTLDLMSNVYVVDSFYAINVF